MARKLSISAIAPYLALAACAWSVAFPSRDIRLVRTLRADIDVVKADNATLRQEVAGIVQFVRDDLPSLVPRLETASGGGSAPDGAASPPVAVSGGRYMVSRGVPGFSVGSDWWLVGDRSPWGIVENAYRGGFSADGRYYSFVQPPSTIEGLNEQ